MRFRDKIRWSLRQIRTRILESLLIVLGIGLGVAVICSVLGLMDFYSTSTQMYTDSLYFRTLEIIPTSRGSSMETREKALVSLGQSDQEPKQLTLEDYYALQEVRLEGTQHIWSVRRFDEAVQEIDDYPEFKSYEEERQWRRDNYQTVILTTPDIFAATQLKVLDGDVFRETDLRERNKVVVMGKGAAEKQFAEEDPIGKELMLKDNFYTVIGVVETQLDPEKEIYIPNIGNVEDLNYAIYIPYLSYNFNNDDQEDNIDSLNILANPEEEISNYYGRLRDYLGQMYGQQLTVQGYFIYQQETDDQIGALQKAIGIFASISLLIAAVNILNLMMARVFRRYKHIGVSTAIGASRNDIFKLFIYEALLLGFFGSIIGLGLAFGALQLLSNFMGTELSLSAIKILIGIGIALVTSLIFGLYPASQAAKINPVDALRTD